MNAKPSTADAIPSEFSGLVNEFQDLLRKYPGSEELFALAYIADGSNTTIPDGPAIASIPVVAYECTKHEGGYVTCKRVHQM